LVLLDDLAGERVDDRILLRRDANHGRSERDCEHDDDLSHRGILFQFETTTVHSGVGFCKATAAPALLLALVDPRFGQASVLLLAQE
jgi:hypothetical protein